VESKVVWRAAVVFIALAAALLTGRTAFAASVDCEAILRDAVFDEYGIRSPEARLRQAQAAFCGLTRSSRAFSVEVIADVPDTEFDRLCGADASDTGADARAILDQAGMLVRNAFNECALMNTGGVSHGVFTTDDPATFTYHVQYAADPNAEATALDVDSFEVQNARCRPGLDRVETGRRTLICTRDPADAVVIGLNTSGNRGSDYLEPLLLNGYAREDEALPVAAVGSQSPADPVSPAVPAAVAPAAVEVSHPYRRFGAKRQMREKACNNPSVELFFEERTQVKLVADAIAQGRGVRYPLWVKVKTGDYVHCERQTWPTGRGDVGAECMVWVNPQQTLIVEAEQGGSDAKCVETVLEVWH
jgi:hypothetical protein